MRRRKRPSELYAYDEQLFFQLTDGWYIRLFSISARSRLPKFDGIDQHSIQKRRFGRFAYGCACRRI